MAGKKEEKQLKLACGLVHICSPPECSRCRREQVAFGRSKGDMKAWNKYFFWATDCQLSDLRAMDKDQHWEKFKELGGEKHIFDQHLWPQLQMEMGKR